MIEHEVETSSSRAKW